MKDIRVVAATVLATVIRDHRSFAQTLSAEQAKLSDKRDIGFLNALCFGVARRYWPLTASLASLLNKPLKPKDTDIQALLLTGLYQLWFMDVPDYAAVASAVEAARTMGKEWACGLVNKLLRKAMEEKEVLQQAWASNEELYFSHPRWLIDEMKVAWPEDWESVLLANAERAPLTLRVQTSRISRDDYARRLMELGIHSRPLEGAKQALLVHNSPPITELPGFVEGLFYVQDLAGQWVVDLLDLAPGQRVLDACAAPGSKTTDILARTPDLEALVAVDNQPDRLAMVAENLKRLGLEASALRLVSADASRPAQWWDGQPFDRVLLDAPCTSTGVIRRHPDILLRRTRDDVDRCSHLQQQLLEQLWRLVKPGGVLVYTTCSVLPAENDVVVKKLLQADVGAKIKNFKIPGSLKTQHGRQLLPSKDHDGFYYARLQKTDA